MKNDIYLIGEVGWEITLQNVIDQVKESDPLLPLEVFIHSNGGSVFDGLAIYNYFKGLNQEVNTNSMGLVASIASIIFLAGVRRVINTNDSFLVHLPSQGLFGTSLDLDKAAKELEQIENKLAVIYENETSLTKDEALALMKEDKFSTHDFLLQNNFVSEVILQTITATLTNKHNNMSEQLTKKEAEGLFEKFFNKFFKKDPVNVVVQDANGAELDFADVEDGMDPAVGDKATVDGAPANGDYVMPSGETYVFDESGALTEIKEAEEAPADDEPTVEDLQATINDLKEQLSASAQIVNERDETITEIEAKKEELKTEFKELKGKIVGNFKYEKKKKAIVVKATARQLLKD